MVAYLKRMDAGIPGTISRADSLTVEQNIQNPAAPITAYGMLAKLVGGKVSPLVSGDAATLVYGLAARPYPQQSFTNGFGASAPPLASMAPMIDILRRGYMSISLSSGGGVSAKGGAVYYRVATASAGKPLYGFEAVADGANTILVAGAIFNGPADANGNVEIQYNI